MEVDDCHLLFLLSTLSVLLNDFNQLIYCFADVVFKVFNYPSLRPDVNRFDLRVALPRIFGYCGQKERDTSVADFINLVTYYIFCPWRAFLLARICSYYQCDIHSDETRGESTLFH